MGDIRRTRKKYEAPGHPWNKERIEKEKAYVRLYGLRNKKEIWKANTILKSIKDQIKRFPSLPQERAAVLEQQLRGRLKRLGLIKEDTPLNDVLGFDTDVILDRRLQTIVYNRGLARSAKQARQFIIHEHILVGGSCVNAPGYLVTADEEQSIEFRAKSSLFAEDHPERAVEEKTPEAPKKGSKSEDLEPEVVELKEEDKQLD